MKVNQKQLKTWLKALRSGKYKQTKGRLQDENGYCCLGVACKVLIPESKQDLSRNGTLRYRHPNGQTHSPKWLKNISEDVWKITDCHLTYYNDTPNFTFNEIADLLESLYLEDV